jgi:hypothetical protein
MRSSIRILDALDKATDEGVDFEDTDFVYFVKKVQALKFAWADKAFIQFVDDVTKDNDGKESSVQ